MPRTFFLLYRSRPTTQVSSRSATPRRSARASRSRSAPPSTSAARPSPPPRSARRSPSRRKRPALAPPFFPFVRRGGSVWTVLESSNAQPLSWTWCSGERRRGREHRRFQWLAKQTLSLTVQCPFRARAASAAVVVIRARERESGRRCARTSAPGALGSGQAQVRSALPHCERVRASIESERSRDERKRSERATFLLVVLLNRRRSLLSRDQLTLAPR